MSAFWCAGGWPSAGIWRRRRRRRRQRLRLRGGIRRSRRNTRKPIRRRRKSRCSLRMRVPDGCTMRWRKWAVRKWRTGSTRRRRRRTNRKRLKSWRGRRKPEWQTRRADADLDSLYKIPVERLSFVFLGFIFCLCVCFSLFLSFCRNHPSN